MLAPDRRPWVAEASGQIVGFVTCGASRSDEPRSGEGEVYAIYVLPGLLGARRRPQPARAR